ncbi:MAG: hypothetical protein PHN46_08900 [Eubacteriales bacterium]|nr:hypothetical protein [Eubacteriales bacterium]
MYRFMWRSKWIGLLASFLFLVASLSPAAGEIADAAGQAIHEPQDSTEAGENVFARLEGTTFYFLSGAGAWSTELVFSSDGNFTGYYHDTDMGDSGSGYPNGTRYECDFSGAFALTERKDEFTYILRLTSITLKQEPGMERVVDGLKLVSAEAYGISGGDEFILYTPGSRSANLPEDFLEWVRMGSAWEVPSETLPFWGLYNLKDQAGFFSGITESE